MQHMWRFAELRAHIRRSFPESCQELLEFLDSIDRSTLLLRYHGISARDALKDLVDESNPHNEENMLLMLGISTNQDEYSYAKLANEAHIIGAIHTIRSMLDMFGQLLNGLMLNNSIPVKDCTIQKARDALPDSALRQDMDELLDSYWFKYVSAFINTVKHRRLVQHAFSLSFQENAAGIRIGAFSYRDDHYDAHWGMDVLKGVYELSNRTVQCGIALNRQLGVQANV